MKIVTIGIDLDKNLCSLAGLDEGGAVVLRRRMKRESVLAFTAQLEVCTVAMADRATGRWPGSGGRPCRPSAPRGDRDAP